MCFSLENDGKESKCETRLREVVGYCFYNDKNKPKIDIKPFIDMLTW